MANLNEITVNINTKLSVEKATAETCLKLVEMYINQTGALITVECRKDGTKKYEFDEVDE